MCYWFLLAPVGPGGTREKGEEFKGLQRLDES